MGVDPFLDIDRRLRAQAPTTQSLVAEGGVEAQFGRTLAHCAAQVLHGGYVAALLGVDGAFAAEQHAVLMLQRNDFAVDELDECIAELHPFIGNCEIH